MNKGRIWLGVGLVGLIGAGLLAPGRARATAEQPSYDILDRLTDGVVVRRYGARLAARVAMAPDGDGRAFRRLAGFIFGGNRGAAGPEKIAMTSPVEVDRAGGTMRFFMPARFTAASLPRPQDSGVAVEELPAQTLAILRFSGANNGETARRACERLLEAVAASPWAAAGEPMFFFYDAPWVPLPLRRNEVVVAVTAR